MPLCLPPISRRRFLSGSVGAGAAALLSAAARADEPQPDPNRFVLVADTHLCGDPEGAKGGVRPAETFAAVREEILALRPRPAALLVAGDCAFMRGQPDDYGMVRTQLDPIREAGLPIYLTLGNHDDRAHFCAAFPEVATARPDDAEQRNVSVVESEHANWFLLDSLQRTAYTPGLLGSAQRKWLAAQLDAHAEKPALLLAHHHLQPSRSGPGLEDTRELLALVASRQQVKAYFHGHVHVWGTGKKDGLQQVSLPPTAWLFDQRQPRGWADVHLTAGSVEVQLNALGGKHPQHGEKYTFAI